MNRTKALEGLRPYYLRVGSDEKFVKLADVLALSSCACGGREPLARVVNFLAEVEPDVDDDGSSGYEVRPHFFAKPGLCDAPVEILVFALPAEEEKV